MTVYSKQPLRPSQHVEQWRRRGLELAESERERAEHYLAVIGYYRLSAYTLPFQLGNPDHRFRPGTQFEHILDLYRFDRELRLLVLDAIERIEVAIRSQLNNHMSCAYGAHWYLDERHFDRKYDHKKLLSEVERSCGRSSEAFVRHYRNKYTEPRLPPSWMVTEMLTYGQLSRVYDNLASFKDQKAIARSLGTTAELLRSWAHAISYLRNLCAHHMRLWNRVLANAPKTPKHPGSNWIRWPIRLDDPGIEAQKRLYPALAVIEYLLQAVNPSSTWHLRFKELMDRYPGVSRTHMGMPMDWDSDPFWRLTREQAGARHD